MTANFAKTQIKSKGIIEPELASTKQSWLQSFPNRERAQRLPLQIARRQVRSRQQVVREQKVEPAVRRRKKPVPSSDSSGSFGRAFRGKCPSLAQKFAASRSLLEVQFEAREDSLRQVIRSFSLSVVLVFAALSNKSNGLEISKK